MSSPARKKVALGVRKVRDAFFTASSDTPNTWICKCGTSRKQTGGGYTNLVSHVKSEHYEDYQNLISEFNDYNHPISQTSSAPSFFFKRKAVEIHEWIDIIINGLLPFSVVNCEHFCRNVRHDKISLPTLHKYIRLLTTRVEQKIQSILPDKFAIILDGWTASDTHFLAVFASFPSEVDCGYRTVLLCFSSFEDESSQGANNHIELLSFVLTLFKKSLQNVVAIIGDNCSTNLSIASILKIKFIGCASHRFNLCVKDLVQEHNLLITKVQNLMKKLKNPIAAAKLREVTSLKAKTCTVTRWSSVFEMLDRYKTLKSSLPNINDDAIEDFFLSKAENRQVEDICTLFEDLNSITKMLQSPNILLSTVKVLFDGVVAKIPSFKSRLAPNTRIVKDPDFESGVSKIQKGRISELTDEEKVATSILSSNDIDVELVPKKNLSYAEKILEEQNNRRVNFMDLRFLTPTSNICERLFSKAGYALNDRRKSVTPLNFKAQMFLHANSELWGLSDINELAK